MLVNRFQSRSGIRRVSATMQDGVGYTLWTRFRNSNEARGCLASDRRIQSRSCSSGVTCTPAVFAIAFMHRTFPDGRIWFSQSTMWPCSSTAAFGMPTPAKRAEFRGPVQSSGRPSSTRTNRATVEMSGLCARRVGACCRLGSASFPTLGRDTAPWHPWSAGYVSLCENTEQNTSRSSFFGEPSIGQ